jgi:hypothetical protein
MTIMIARKGKWLAAQVEETLLMMSAEQGNYIGLDDIGARIWALLEQPLALETLYDLLTAEYDVNRAVIQSDLEAFLKIMSENGAITLTDAPA